MESTHARPLHWLLPLGSVLGLRPGAVVWAVSVEAPSRAEPSPWRPCCDPLSGSAAGGWRHGQSVLELGKHRAREVVACGLATPTVSTPAWGGAAQDETLPPLSRTAPPHLVASGLPCAPCSVLDPSLQGPESRVWPWAEWAGGTRRGAPDGLSPQGTWRFFSLQGPPDSAPPMLIFLPTSRAAHDPGTLCPASPVKPGRPGLCPAGRFLAGALPEGPPRTHGACLHPCGQPRLGIASRPWQLGVGSALAVLWSRRAEDPLGLSPICKTGCLPPCPGHGLLLPSASCHLLLQTCFVRLALNLEAGGHSSRQPSACGMLGAVPTCALWHQCAACSVTSVTCPGEGRGRRALCVLCPGSEGPHVC